VNPSPEKERFDAALQGIEQIIGDLKAKNRELVQENTRLKTKLKEMQKGQSDIFDVISETERMKLKHSISALMAKIDKRIQP
tara:strand:- start:3339 stop:3584 length:246 start_codon:yes stop_codon:yes gene_type:complete